MSKRIVAWVVFAGLAGCALGYAARFGMESHKKEEGQEHAKLNNVSMAMLGRSLVFLDRDTGNLWVYVSADQPAVLMGKLDSFDKPLVTEAFKAPHEKAAATPIVVVPAPPLSVAAAAGDSGPIADQLNALPKNLWPAEGENEIKREAREQWFKENVKPGTGTFTGKLTSVSASGEKVTAHFEVEKVSILGQDMTLYMTAKLDDLKPADVMDWTHGKAMTISGLIAETRPEPSMFGAGYVGVYVTIDHAKVK